MAPVTGPFFLAVLVVMTTMLVMTAVLGPAKVPTPIMARTACTLTKPRGLDRRFRVEALGN